MDGRAQTVVISERGSRAVCLLLPVAERVWSVDMDGDAAPLAVM
jgi:hypothetical protein